MTEAVEGFVLDASVLLALINNEAGADVVIDALRLPDTVISAVNYSEVVAKLISIGMPAEVVQYTLQPLSLTIYDFDGELAEKAGFLYLTTKKLGLSFGDRACLALADHLGLPALTADQAWKQLKDIKVRTLR